MNQRQGYNMDNAPELSEHTAHSVCISCVHDTLTNCGQEMHFIFNTTAKILQLLSLVTSLSSSVAIDAV